MWNGVALLIIAIPQDQQQAMHDRHLVRYLDSKAVSCPAAGLQLCPDFCWANSAHVAISSSAFGLHVPSVSMAHVDKRREGPEDTPECPRDSWFNIFVLHQNRVPHTQSSKDCLRESYLPGFLDFVVWGHEHECIIDPWVWPALLQEFMMCVSVSVSNHLQGRSGGRYRRCAQ